MADNGVRAEDADATGATVMKRFKEFLTDYRPNAIHTLNDGGNQGELVNNVTIETSDAELTSQQRLTYDYVAQLALMAQNNKTTLFVNFQHMVEMDIELAEAVELDYYRFEPFLRQAIATLISEMHSADGTTAFVENAGPKPEYAVSFYSMSRVERIRTMRTDKLGRLMSISGTVTRSSDVR